MYNRQLEYFLAISKLGSATAAAKELDTAQPLVSRQIGLLEKRWGGRLFERNGRGLELSAFGERMLPEVEALLALARRVELSASEVAGVVSGKVHVGIVPSIARELTPALFQELVRAAPLVKLQMSEGFSGQLDEQLIAGRIDIAVLNRYGRKVRPQDDVVGRDVALLVGRSGDELLRGPTINFQRLAGLPLVLPSVPNEFRLLLDQHARRLGFELNVVLEVDNLRAMKESALAGYGYTVLSSLGVYEDMRQGVLACIQIVRPSLPRTTVLGVGTHRPLSLAGRLVLAKLHALAPRLARSSYRPS
jgi:LysR family nitrogen assimilation transcriptional regulator